MALHDRIAVGDGLLCAMDQRALDDLAELLPPLLTALERLNLLARHFDPPRFAQLMEAIGEPDAAVRAELPRLEAWPEDLVDVREALHAAGNAVTAAFEGLRGAPDAEDGLMAVFRALRHPARALEALYPLAAVLPPVSRFFLEPGKRQDAELLQRLASPEPGAEVGVFHVGNGPDERGGFSLYVPETYTADRAWPMVFALHGGSGHGRGFLWSWLRDTRAHGAILLAPTAIGRTWALTGDDVDSPNLARMVEFVGSRWNIDPDRRLLAGMSDGGTFAYVSGLETGSPFTHLAPTAAAFHPMLAQFAEPERVKGLPIHITHGVRDWMFEVGMARAAARFLETAGADVVYVELPDLAHSYPGEMNPQILAWLKGT
jgi:phospholipase/carboxylesterase